MAIIFTGDRSGPKAIVGPIEICLQNSSSIGTDTASYLVVHYSREPHDLAYFS